MNHEHTQHLYACVHVYLASSVSGISQKQTNFGPLVKGLKCIVPMAKGISTLFLSSSLMVKFYNFIFSWCYVNPIVDRLLAHSSILSLLRNNLN